MNPKLLFIFAIVVISAAMMWLDYQHGNSRRAQIEAPSIAMADMTFQPVDESPSKQLSDYRGHYVLLNAWASWCPPCVKEFPELIALAKEHPEELQLITLSADRSREKAQEFLQQFETLPNALHAYDEGGKQARDALQVYQYPESLLLDTQGNLIAKYAGELQPNDIAFIRDYLKN